MTELERAVRELVSDIDSQEVGDDGVFPITSRFHGLYKGPQNSKALQQVRDCLTELEESRDEDTKVTSI